MRTFWLVIVLVVAAATPASADFDGSKRWFESLSDDARYQLQADLILLGHYNAFADGEFGPSTYKGLTAYQKKLGHSLTGILSSGLLKRLHESAEDVAVKWGIDVVEDEASGATFLMPTKLLSVSKRSDFGTAYSSPDFAIRVETFKILSPEQPFQSLYNEAAANLDGRVVAYKNINDSRFVVSGRDHEAMFYTLFLNTGSESIGFNITWTDTYRTNGPITAAYIASHFVPSAMLQESKPATPPAIPAGQPSTTTKVTTLPSAANDHATIASQPADGEWIGGFYVANQLPEVIALSGEITQATPLEFLRALKARPEARILILNSPGGLVDPALVVAHEVKERKLDTIVIEGFGCYSACAFIYFAGTNRMVAGELGVHQIWNEANDLKSGQAKLSDVIEALEEFGIDSGVLSIMLRTPPEDMHVFTASEIERFSLNLGTLHGSTRLEQPTKAEAPSNLLSADADAPLVNTSSMSFVTSVTGTVVSMLTQRNVSVLVANEVQRAFETGFKVSIIPKNVTVSVLLGPALNGSEDVPYRVDIFRLPKTLSAPEGQASVVLKRDGSYVPTKTDSARNPISPIG